MQEERNLPRQQGSEGAHAVFTDAATETIERSGAQVVHGAFDEQLPVAGLTVAEVRQQFRDDIHLHPEAMALLDGLPVTDDTTVVRAGQHLLFIRRSGEKGVGA